MLPPDPYEPGKGFSVRGFLPQDSLEERTSPFYLLDYSEKKYLPPAEEKREVGEHPHRGLECLTLLYEGKVKHCDSFGNTEILNSGDSIFLSSGSGITHNIIQSEDFVNQGGFFQMVQMWIALPQEYKMIAPSYQVLRKAETPVVYLENKMGKVEILAGEFQNKKGDFTSSASIEMYNVYLEKNGQTKLSFPEKYNTGLLVLEGSLKINHEKEIPKSHFVLFENEGTDIEFEAPENTVFLIFSGKPLNEPVIAHGPFLMNSMSEIIKAYDDYNEGLFGKIENCDG